jgi:hypothetical protein
MKIKMNFASPYGSPGTIVDLPASTAKAIIASGDAVLLAVKNIEKAVYPKHGYYRNKGLKKWQ